MKRNTWVLLIFLLLLGGSDVFAQSWRLRRYEGQLYLGSTTMHGDIGLANKSLLNNFNGIRPSAGFIARYALTRDLGVSLDLSYMMYGGRDQEGSSHNRLYSFTTNAFQHTLRLEYYLLGSNKRHTSSAIYNRRGMVNSFSKVNLYMYLGIGGTLSKAVVHDLRNEGREPLNNPGYHPEMQYAVVFPVGAGFKWAVNARWSLGTEIGYQFTFSDKLDGYAPAASRYKDSYYILSLRVIYKLRNNRANRPVFNRLYR